MEVVSGEISEELRATIYHSTFSMNAIELSLCYGTLLCCVVSVALFGLGMSRRRRQAQAAADELTIKSAMVAVASVPKSIDLDCLGVPGQIVDAPDIDPAESAGAAAIWKCVYYLKYVYACLVKSNGWRRIISSTDLGVLI